MMRFIAALSDSVMAAAERSAIFIPVSKCF